MVKYNYNGKKENIYMPGYVIHVAVAQEYLKKHKNNENKEEFVKGTIEPDLIKPKTLSHYGKSPAYTNLKKFLESNEIETSFQKGFFLHLITDYLFYNHYLDKFSREDIYNDYDILNARLIEKYNVQLPEKVKQYVFNKEGITKILSEELACKVIDEISNLKMEDIQKEVLEDNEKWTTYKNLI